MPDKPVILMACREKHLRKINTRTELCTRTQLHQWFVTHYKSDVSVVLLKDDYYTILLQLINDSRLEITGEWWQHIDKRSSSIIREAKHQARLALQGVNALILPGSNSYILSTFYDEDISSASPNETTWQYDLWSELETKATKHITKTILNMALINLAMMRGMPIFGICAGFTTFNVFIGNTIRVFWPEELEEYLDQCIGTIPNPYDEEGGPEAAVYKREPVDVENYNQLIHITTHHSEFWHFLNSFDKRSKLSQQSESSSILTTRAYVAHSFSVSPHNIPETNGYFKKLFLTTAETVIKKNNDCYIQAIEQLHGAPVFLQQSHFEVDAESRRESSQYIYETFKLVDLMFNEKNVLRENNYLDELGPNAQADIGKNVNLTLEENGRNLRWTKFIISSTTTHYHKQQVIRELSEKFAPIRISSEPESILDSREATAATQELPDVNIDDVNIEIGKTVSELELPKNIARYNAVFSL